MVRLTQKKYISFFFYRQAGKSGWRTEAKRARRRLARCRASLTTAENNLAVIAAAGRPGRSNAGVASPNAPTAAPKASPNLLPWSDAEVAALREAIADCGPGQWKVMYDKYKDRFHPLRTRFNLRDRYRLLNAKKLW